MFRALRKFWSKSTEPSTLSDVEVFERYCDILENLESIGSLDRLPASKTRIKSLLITAAGVADASMRHHIFNSYLALARFQDTKLHPLSAADVSSIGSMKGEQLLNKMLGLKDQFEDLSALTKIVSSEERALALEWQRAGMEN
jgi:hypothetical protein